MLNRYNALSLVLVSFALSESIAAQSASAKVEGDAQLRSQVEAAARADGIRTEAGLDGQASAAAGARGGIDACCSGPECDPVRCRTC